MSSVQTMQIALHLKYSPLSTTNICYYMYCVSILHVLFLRSKGLSLCSCTLPVITCLCCLSIFAPLLYLLELFQCLWEGRLLELKWGCTWLWRFCQPGATSAVLFGKLEMYCIWTRYKYTHRMPLRLSFENYLFCYRNRLANVYLVPHFPPSQLMYDIYTFIDVVISLLWCEVHLVYLPKWLNRLVYCHVETCGDPLDPF